MMKTQLFSLLLVLGCSLVWAHKDCPEHQHHSECGAGCQINCEERNEPKLCNKMCVAGCVCDKGWILERAGSHTCIPKGHCKTCPKNTHFNCPEHQHHSECGAGCQINCEERNEPKPCNKMCVAGCVCDKGWILERAGSHTCIPKGHCKTCPKNTHFSECGAKCQRTCENYKQENIPCPMMCAPGCVCDKGYALHNGKCIHTSECVKH